MDITGLFNKAKDGDSEAENELCSILLVRFRLIATQIIGNSDSARDAAQDALVSVLKTYRQLEVHTSFIAWAQSIIRRQALKHVRKRGEEQRITREINPEMNTNPGYEISPLFEMRLVKCLDSLFKIDKRYVRVLNLKHQGFTFEEICARLNISHNNAYVLLHRARKALLSCLNKEKQKS